MDEEKNPIENVKQFVTDFFSGMTRTQIIILAGMAVFLVLAFCLGAWIVLRNMGTLIFSPWPANQIRIEFTSFVRTKSLKSIEVWNS